jgi:hypothetical protein
MVVVDSDVMVDKIGEIKFDGDDFCRLLEQSLTGISSSV